jgi:uncharacterized UPF0146 family protein
MYTFSMKAQDKTDKEKHPGGRPVTLKSQAVIYCVRLPADVAARIEAIAKEQGKGVSNVIRDLIGKALRRTVRVKPYRRGEP